MKFLGALLSFLLGLLPTVSAPDWLASAPGTLANAIGFIPAIASNWYPVQALAHGVLFILGCMAVAFAVRFTRMAVSVFTGGGGGAA